MACSSAVEIEKNLQIGNICLFKCRRNKNNPQIGKFGLLKCRRNRKSSQIGTFITLSPLSAVKQGPNSLRVRRALETHTHTLYKIVISNTSILDAKIMFTSNLRSIIYVHITIVRVIVVKEK